MTLHGSNSLVELLEMLFHGLAGSIPMLLAYLTALVIIIVRWRQSPRASMLALCGVLFGLFLIVTLPFVYSWATQKYATCGNSMVQLQSVFSIIGAAGSFCHAISFGFLFLAIYADRRYPTPPPQGY